MRLREAGIRDAKTLIQLIQCYRHLFFDDFDELDTAFITNLVLKNEILVVEDSYKRTKGLFWFERPVQRLKTTIHFLIEPSWLRPVIRQDIIIQALDYAFNTLDVRKIKAETLETQTMAMKLLKRFGFKPCGVLTDETVKNTKYIDINLFELLENDWNAIKGDLRYGIV